MLDTNICIYIIKKRPPTVLECFNQISSQEICISIITLTELQYGVDKSAFKQLNQSIIDNFVSRLQVLSWDRLAVKYYGQIRANLDKKGTPMGLMDFMIASHCLSLNYTLITNNIKEFKRISELKIENWV